MNSLSIIPDLTDKVNSLIEELAILTDLSEKLLEENEIFQKRYCQLKFSKFNENSQNFSNFSPSNEKDLLIKVIIKLKEEIKNLNLVIFESKMKSEETETINELKEKLNKLKVEVDKKRKYENPEENILSLKIRNKELNFEELSKEKEEISISKSKKISELENQFQMKKMDLENLKSKIVEEKRDLNERINSFEENIKSSPIKKFT